MAVPMKLSARSPASSSAEVRTRLEEVKSTRRSVEKQMKRGTKQLEALEKRLKNPALGVLHQPMT